jgi:hypothetical protein
MMQNHAQSTMLPPHDCNPITCLWERLRSNVTLNHRLSKWFKIAKLCMVIVLGNLEDESTFSNLTFIKTKLQNCLTTHLDLIVWMYVHKFYDLKSFSFYLELFMIGMNISCDMALMHSSHVALHYWFCKLLVY